MDESLIVPLVWITFAVFVGPTIGAFIWAGIHHWDLPDEMEHPA